MRQSKKLPGPGTYSPKGEINKDGDYYPSQYQSSLCRTFYHHDRNTLENQKSLNSKVLTYILATPGPGTYRLPSDFGQYEAKMGTTQ